jgi:hypothetical protein
MKKKTTITTEKREVWVIRQPLESSHEPDDDAVRRQENKKALAVLTEEGQPEDAPSLENE